MPRGAHSPLVTGGGVVVGPEGAEIDVELARGVRAVDHARDSRRPRPCAQLLDREADGRGRGDLADEEDARPLRHPCPHRLDDLLRSPARQLYPPWHEGRARAPAGVAPDDCHRPVLVIGRQHLVAGPQLDRARRDVDAGGRVRNQDQAVGVGADGLAERGANAVEERGQTAAEQVDRIALELALPALVLPEDRLGAGSERAVVQVGDPVVEQEGVAQPHGGSVRRGPARGRGYARARAPAGRLPPLAQSGAAPLGADPPAGRAHQLLRQRAGDPVPLHLPPQRPGHRPRHGRPRAGDERRRRAPLRSRRRVARRPHRRTDRPRAVARTAGGRLRPLPADHRAVARLRREHPRGRRHRRLLAGPVVAHRRAHSPRPAPDRIRHAADHHEPRLRARRPRRRPDRDHLRSDELHDHLPRQRGDVPRLPGSAARRPRARARADAGAVRLPGATATCCGTAPSWR